MRCRVVDLVYSPATGDETRALGVVYDSVSHVEREQLSPTHTPVVFLSRLDSSEIQRASSKKIPVMVPVSTLQGAFDLLKMNGVKLVYVEARGNVPLIDFGWMQKAFEEKKSVVFSLRALRTCFEKKDVDSLQEYRKLARLLEKSHVPMGLVSLAREKWERSSDTDAEAWKGYLGVSSFDLGWFV